jgi:hypothetical protein
LEAFVLIAGLLGVSLVVGGAIHTIGHTLLRRLRRDEIEHLAVGELVNSALGSEKTGAQQRHFENILLREAACEAGPLKEVRTTLNPRDVTCSACLGWLRRT